MACKSQAFRSVVGRPAARPVGGRAGGVRRCPPPPLPVRAAAARPAADCQPFSGRPCLFPYPDNRLTRHDGHSATGRRVNLPAAGMPVNTAGQQLAAGPYDVNDGFSPGSAIIIHIPGLTSPRALARTGAVTLTNMSRAFARRQPIVIIDQATGRRQLIWAELDANVTGAANIDLLIHPGKDFLDGHTYIVALRNLRTAAGHRIRAPRWFARLRDGGRLPQRRALAALTLQPHLQGAQARGDRAGRPVRGVELHGRVRSGPDRPAVGHPQRRLRPAG